MTRRKMLAVGGAALVRPASAQGTATHFQVGCMTNPYSAFPLERGLAGVAKAGYRFVGWGSGHRGTPPLGPDAPASQARELAIRCREMGLEPVMMFAGTYIEAPDCIKVYTRRIEQAAAAKIPFIISFGKTSPGSYQEWIHNLKELGPVARGAAVTITIKQHGGNSATGRAISKILAEVADEGVKMCYDAGNVLDYEKLDPIADIQACWRDVRSFAIKDHRNTPKSQDCGPGFGEIDHYKLLMPVLRTGLTIPLVCENIFEPLVPRPENPETIDALAHRAREYLEAVIRGLQA